MNPSQEAMEQFDAHLGELERQHGVELSDADRRELFAESVRGGFNPDATVAAWRERFDTDDDAWDDDRENMPAWDDDGGDWDEDEPEIPPPSTLRRMGQEDWVRAKQDFTFKFGRELTKGEEARLREAAQTERSFMDRWLPEHFERAAQRSGIKNWADMDDQEQAEVMAQRIAEKSGVDRDPATGLTIRESYDMTDEQQWAEAAALRLSGHEFEGAE